MLALVVSESSGISPPFYHSTHVYQSSNAFFCGFLLDPIHALYALFWPTAYLAFNWMGFSLFFIHGLIFPCNSLETL